MYRQVQERQPPLPDTEAIASCTISRAGSNIEFAYGCPLSLRARVLRWADQATAAGLGLMALCWSDGTLCFVVVPGISDGRIPIFAPWTILAAYRHAQRDVEGRELFYAQPENAMGGAHR